MSSSPCLSALHTVPRPLTEALSFSQTELGFIICSGMKKSTRRKEYDDSMHDLAMASPTVRGPFPSPKDMGS